MGMMGSGKSTVGALLAERTGWPFHDNDVLLRELFDATPRQILTRTDEASLLAAEVDALLAGLQRPPPAIVVAAGGTIIDRAAREAMARAGITVWLRVSPDTILRRSSGGEHRPWPEADRAAWIERAVAQRHALYEATAHLVLDADATPPSDLADQILAHVRAVSPCLPTDD
jgi:shikimate kinase